MTQISRSYHEVVPGSKSEVLRVNFDLHLTLFFDALKNTNNSMELIDPFVLELLFKKAHVALGQINWETVSNESKPRKSPTETTKTTKRKKRSTLGCKTVKSETTTTSIKAIVTPQRESMSISKIGEQKLSESNNEMVNDGLKSTKDPTKIMEMGKINKLTTLDTKNVKDETAFNIKKVKGEDSAALELEESIGKHKHESKCEVTLNEAQSIKKISDSQKDLISDERSATSSKSPNKSKSRPGRKKLKPKKDPTCEKNEPTLKPDNASADSMLITGENEVKTSAYKKKKEIEAARRDFSIKNVDPDKIDYRKECRDTLSCFTADGYDEAYTYLLLDPTKLEGTLNVSFDDFIDSIFYIGKGTARRALKHATDTEKWLKDDRPPCPTQKKFEKIEKIWTSRKPIKVFKITKGITDQEAYTREAAMIDVMGLDILCNENRGTYYKKIKQLEARKCLELGANLLVEAWNIFKGKKPDVVDLKPKNKKTFEKIHFNDDPDVEVES